MVSTMCISFRATTKARGILCGDGLDYKGDCADADKHSLAQLFGVTECKGEKASSACRPRAPLPRREGLEFLHFATLQDDDLLQHRQEWRCHSGTGTPACALRFTSRNVDTRGLLPRGARKQTPGSLRPGASLRYSSSSSTAEGLWAATILSAIIGGTMS